MNAPFARDLVIVIPVYNEADIIEELMHNWAEMLRKLDIQFQLHAYNDGSKDTSLKKLKTAQKAIPELEVFDKPNTGHGPTILQGYKHADAEYVFQVDSDDEIKSTHFQALWNARSNYDFIIAEREFQYAPPLSRWIISKIARWVVAIFYASGIKDVNCPYRLFRKTALEDVLHAIPNDTFAPNLLLSGFAAKKKLRIYSPKVPAYFRRTGQVSIRHFKLFSVALQSFFETIVFSFRI